MHSAITLALLAGSAVVVADELRAGVQAVSLPRAIPAAMMKAPRQVDNGGCTYLETPCGGKCYDLTDTCCPDNLGACGLGDVCQKGDDGRYGCCEIGQQCVGSAPEDEDEGPIPTPTAGSGGSGGINIPTFTPTGVSGGNSDSGDSGSGGSANTGSDSVFALPSNTGFGGMSASGGSGSFPTGVSGGVSEACMAAVSSMQSNPAPTPAPELAKALGSMTDYCKFNPGSLSNEWSSFTKASQEWQKDNKDVVEKIQKECPQAQGVPDVTKCGSASAVSVSKCAVLAGAMVVVAAFL
jgi:hypothetical protein